MLSDFDMIRHQMDGDITIYPISDVHYGALEHCSTAWKAFCDKIEADPKAFVILGGDLINNNVRTCGFVNPYDETVRPREQKKHMVEFLKPIADRVLCMVSGNHERRSMKDDDVDLTYDIATKLDIEDRYRQNIAFMKVSLGKRHSEDKPVCSYAFAVTHGAGGGIYTGATVNRNERFGNVIDGIDCFVVGHTHKGTVSRPSKIVFDGKNNVVSMKEYAVISCVSWLNFGGYAMQKMLLPAAVTNPQKIILHETREKNLEIRW